MAVGPHASNQHHEPGDAAIGPDQVLLLDLWARLPGEGTVFADVTWMAYTGPQPPRAVMRANRSGARKRKRAAG